MPAPGLRRYVVSFFLGHAAVDTGSPYSMSK